MPSGCQPGGSLPDTSKKRPSVMMNATPRAMPITPSVAMNGGRPHEHDEGGAHRARQQADGEPGGDARGQRVAARSTNSCPATTPASAITAPGERSTPPEMITMAAPTAAMP